MKVDDMTAEAVKNKEEQRHRHAWLSVMWMSVLAAALVSTILLYSRIPLQTEMQLAVALCTLFLVAYVVPRSAENIRGFRQLDGLLQQFNSGLSSLSSVMSRGTAEALSSAIKAIKAQKNDLLDSLIAAREDDFGKLIDSRYRKELQDCIDLEVDRFKERYKKQAVEFRNQHPLYKARFALESAEKHLKQRRAELDAEWKKAYEGFSWWNKLKYGETPDFKELDQKIKDLKIAQILLHRKHHDDFDKLNCYYEDLAKKAYERVTHATIQTEAYIWQSKYEDSIGSDVLQKGLWFAALSVPISIWSDVDQAGDVYGVLRSVNGSYADLSDSEIWWETLFLPSESLAGLVSLTKGAYLETLVASDSGGQLFEHFNHPDTDIVIDGIAFQIKATDSADYINTVADGIPVITTSEVAELTGAIDSGYTNEELQEAVSLAVGGSVIDAGDTTVDAILAGVGGLGLFATLAGINHAVDKFDNGGDPVEAMFEGAGVAIEGTARAAVNTLELGYNILNSRPSRFVGRVLLKGATALDKKLTEPPKNSQ